MEGNVKETERRSTKKKTAILDETMPNDLATAQTAANVVTNKISEKQKQAEKKAKIKKTSDTVGIIILIGLAIYLSINLVEQDLNNGIIWLFLGLSCGAIGSTAVRYMRKKNELPAYERYNVQIVNGQMAVYPDVIKQKMFVKMDAAIAWADDEVNESQSWRIMDIMDGKIVKTLEEDTKKH